MAFWEVYIAYLVTQQFHYWLYTNRNTGTCAPGGIYKHVQSSTNHNNQKLEATQMFISNRRDKL